MWEDIGVSMLHLQYCLLYTREAVTMDPVLEQAYPNQIHSTGLHGPPPPVPAEPPPARWARALFCVRCTLGLISAYGPLTYWTAA
jgi:hypothetical protein